MSDPNSESAVPVTGEIPDDSLLDTDIPGDGSDPTTEEQILSDADLTDIPEPNMGPAQEPDPSDIPDL
jgi:hypothetical protein